MKAIMMLVNEFPPLPVGGAERQAERLSEWLVQQGWHVRVLTRSANNLSAQEEKNGILITRPRTFGPGKMRTLTFLSGVFYQLWKQQKEYRILHAHLGFGPAFAAVIFGRLIGKKVIIKLGNSGEFGDIRVSKATLRGRIRLAVFRAWADKIILLDQEMYAEAIQAGFPAGKLVQMNNGINAKQYMFPADRTQAKKELGFSNKTVIVYTGRLAPQKSLSTLIHGLSIALPNCPDLHLILVGDGPEKERLEAEIQRLGISEQVNFLGNQPDVKPYLAAGDIFALPSNVEGISNALLEAMAAGLACLVTPVGGNLEVVEDGKNGLLIPVGDVSAWGKALAEVGSSPAYFNSLGKAAQIRIADTYDFAVVGKQYEDLYESLDSQEIQVPD